MNQNSLNKLLIKPKHEPNQPVREGERMMELFTRVRDSSDAYISKHSCKQGNFDYILQKVEFMLKLN